ncbi:hypothetical protein R4M05_09190 [Brachyspira intermedia]
MIITNNINAIRANRYLKVNSTEHKKKFPSLFASEKGPLVQGRYMLRAEKILKTEYHLYKQPMDIWEKQ